MKPEFLDIFSKKKKYSNIKFYENSFSGSKELFRADGRTYKQAYRQMDRYDEVRCRFSQFCEHA